MKKVAQIISIVLVAALIIVGGRWYMYVAYAKSPYDEVGIALNGYVPDSLRTWGCQKMQQRFARQLPPYGCAGADGRSWL
jgi:hypothetical protein